MRYEVMTYGEYTFVYDNKDHCLIAEIVDKTMTGMVLESLNMISTLKEAGVLDEVLSELNEQQNKPHP